MWFNFFYISHCYKLNLRQNRRNESNLNNQKSMNVIDLNPPYWPPNIISLNLFNTFSHVPDLTYFPKSDIFMYVCLVLITLLVNRLAVTIYLVELVDLRKHNVALK